jgi:hypothetical protein
VCQPAHVALEQGMMVRTDQHQESWTVLDLSPRVKRPSLDDGDVEDDDSDPASDGDTVVFGRAVRRAGQAQRDLACSI